MVYMVLNKITLSTNVSSRILLIATIHGDLSEQLIKLNTDYYVERTNSQDGTKAGKITSGGYKWTKNLIYSDKEMSAILKSIHVKSNMAQDIAHFKTVVFM